MGVVLAAIAGVFHLHYRDAPFSDTGKDGDATDLDPEGCLPRVLSGVRGQEPPGPR